MMTQTQVLKQLNMYTHNIHNKNILQLTRRACHNNYGISTRPVHVKVFAIQLTFNNISGQLPINCD